VKSVSFRNLSLECEARMIGGKGWIFLFIFAGSMTVAVLSAVDAGSLVFATDHL
jgi:hypothetical protein